MGAIACPCPPLAGGEPRHADGDTVTFKARLGFVEATALRKHIDIYRMEKGRALTSAEALAVLSEAYILYTIESWTLEGEDGKPIPVTPDSVTEHILPNWRVALVLSDEADDLYAGPVMLPLIEAASTSSRPGQTERSTSPRTPSGTPVPKPSSPSSISTIPTDDTATTTSPPDGDSKSSRRSRSAA